MTNSDDESDLFSDITDLDMVRHLLRDLHEDIGGKLARFRQLTDLSDALGSSGTMLYGGEITFAAWREARWSFIHGNFVATVLVCQGLVEHLLGSFLHTAFNNLPKRISFAETLQRCREQKILSERDATDLRRLMELRNPLSHFRDLDDTTNLTRLVMSSLEPAVEHLRSDATFAIGIVIRTLALPAFSPRI